jgi:hypothetical protein
MPAMMFRRHTIATKRPVPRRRFNIEAIAAVGCLWVYYLRSVEITSNGTPYLARHPVGEYIGELALLAIAAGFGWSAVRRGPGLGRVVGLLVFAIAGCLLCGWLWHLVRVVV